eukprot:CAMPEP_0201285624 /NCGR_PEP_ID=MMETSP1317-20130820/113591_1 /ASSEMBLY_ACC=CAM_ASM_000770 /TAXON_ID=187299 /ORGANISM="Undescribed Undescribed, Strain Undescribed" /LENGTH=100 /DNA_ID=CAMNT_0047611269 /DNA_START=214 /DNA_END=516 /DNA_ORIENTATION=+
MIIEAPEVRLKVYESPSPIIIKVKHNTAEIIIIMDTDFAYFSEIYGGIVNRAITKIRPTAFIIMTTETATIARSKKLIILTDIPRSLANSASYDIARICL